MLTLGELEGALRCALPLLAAGDDRFALATCLAVRRRGKIFVVSTTAAAWVPASGSSKQWLLLSPLASARPELSIAAAADDQALCPLDLDTVQIDGAPAPSAKLFLRGFPRERARIDYDDGQIRWPSFAGTARLSAPGELLLDEPDSLASMDGLEGAPIFSLSRSAISFAGLLLHGEKRSVRGRASFLPAAGLVAAVDFR